MRVTKGFSLIELMVVVGIIGLLAAAAMLSFSRQRGSARDARRVSDLASIQSAVESYINEKTEPLTTTQYGADNSGGWDVSSINDTSGKFMSFLQSAGLIRAVPVDPINDATSATSGYGYRYHYYNTKSYDIDGDGDNDYSYYQLEAIKMETATPKPLYKEPVVPK